MLGIAVRLEEWRCAERRRDALPRGSPEWIAADEDVRRARSAYRAEASQAEVYYAEVEVPVRDRFFARWRARVDRSTAVER